MSCPLKDLKDLNSLNVIETKSWIKLEQFCIYSVWTYVNLALFPVTLLHCMYLFVLRMFVITLLIQTKVRVVHSCSIKKLSWKLMSSCRSFVLTTRLWHKCFPKGFNFFFQKSFFKEQTESCYNLTSFSPDSQKKFYVREKCLRTTRR